MDQRNQNVVRNNSVGKNERLSREEKRCVLVSCVYCNICTECIWRCDAALRNKKMDRAEIKAEKQAIIAAAVERIKAEKDAAKKRKAEDSTEKKESVRAKLEHDALVRAAERANAKAMKAVSAATIEAERIEKEADGKDKDCEVAFQRLNLCHQRQDDTNSRFQLASQRHDATAESWTAVLMEYLQYVEAHYESRNACAEEWFARAGAATLWALAFDAREKEAIAKAEAADIRAQGAHECANVAQPDGAREEAEFWRREAHNKHKEADEEREVAAEARRKAFSAQAEADVLRTDVSKARLDHTEATQLQELQGVVDAAHARIEAAKERERNAEARSEVWERNAEGWDARAESYDAAAKMSYVRVQAAKKRGESTCELMVEWNDARKEAADCRAEAVDSRKEASDYRAKALK